MDAKQFLSIMQLEEKLKCNTRHVWTSDGRHESIAEHSWRLTTMAYFIRSEVKDADFDKIMLMCLLHDIGEAFTGDIPSFFKTENDEDTENNEVIVWINSMPEPYKTELTELFNEMWALETREARIFKALDKMEAVIQHNHSPISTWIPLEYEANIDYGTEEAGIDAFLTRIRDEVRQITKEKIANECPRESR